MVTTIWYVQKIGLGWIEELSSRNQSVFCPKHHFSDLEFKPQAVGELSCIVALVDLLRSWGVVPMAVVRHSSGEIAAAYAAEALSRKTCLKIALHRGLVSILAQERSPGAA
ncbi:hypothetical protein N7495_007859 [Penicillium taxi]|uniref:uncharacterized protein n=1 Tax=Penicillium taxi TaxID=168475 RepID=UPI002545366C|nr:uncharacterized protein N7495_007859 [Penicillium taxi]KAJ5887818.1 hypothetical protein N7495_007859 [Penicillium taxi]